MQPSSSGHFVCCTTFLIRWSCLWILELHSSASSSLTHVCLVCPHEPQGPGQGYMGVQLWASSYQRSCRSPLPPACASACLQHVTKVTPSWMGSVAVVPPDLTILHPSPVPGKPWFKLFFFFKFVFCKCRKKVFSLIIKISLFCILQYISNISTMKH